MDDATRSVVIPVSVPLGNDPDGNPWTWQTFNAAMLTNFRLSTCAAQWCIRELFKRDNSEPKTPEAVKQGKESDGRFYAYGEFFRCTRCGVRWYEGEAPRNRVTKKKPPQCRCTGEPAPVGPSAGAWSGAAQSLGICLQYAHKKYLAERAAVVRGDSSLLTVRFPYPFPVDADAWGVRFDEGGFPVASVALPGLGRVELRLKRSGDFARQLAMVRQFVTGAAKKGEAALYRNRKGQLLLKMVGKFPRRERTDALPPSADPMPTLPSAEADGRVTPEALAAEMPSGAGSVGGTEVLARASHRPNVCFLHTDPNALLVAEINGRSVVVTNGDHLKRAHAVIRETAARHKAFVQRAGEDKKREVRMDRRQRANLNQKVEERCAKQRARIDTAVKQIAAQVARFCERQRVGVLAYDDSVKSFLPDGFVWHALKTRIDQLFRGEMGGEWIDGTAHGGFVSITDEKGRGEWLARVRALLTTVPKVAAHKSRPRGKSHPGVSTPRAT